ncbi:MAG: 16S rRNA (uracil(1498)-N(3))-methyltransferase [Eubacteriales bacterium]|jgi:16S rRNA (uracil1498-N3)-methyltransferase|nr:16S rRNA (uracil(1498)-N(3))-methyltransferase [Eubacteriales bacterium]
MRRFFCDNITTETATITGDDAHHISRVLRMKAGDALSLCDGAGNEFDAVIATVSPEAVVCTVGNKHASEAESPVRVTLFQCLPKTDKMELIVQKCTELGVFAIVPVHSVRCVVVPGKDYDKKRERYSRVALEAAKQSRRAMVPQVLPLIKLKKIDIKSFDLFLIAYEDENARTLKQALRGANTPATIAILIGPEGGLEEDEVAQLTAAGAVSVSLGRRILRTETAGMAMLAQTLYEVEA